MEFEESVRVRERVGSMRVWEGEHAGTQTRSACAFAYRHVSSLILMDGRWLQDNRVGMGRVTYNIYT